MQKTSSYTPSVSGNTTKSDVTNEIADSDYSDAGSIMGSYNDQAINVTCDMNFTGGGEWTCDASGSWVGDTCETYCKTPGGIPVDLSYGGTTCICAPDYYGYGCTTQCPSGTFFDKKIQKCSPIPQGKKDCIGEWNNCSPDPSNNNKCMQKYTIISPLKDGGSPCPYNNNEMQPCPYENGCQNNNVPPDIPGEHHESDTTFSGWIKDHSQIYPPVLIGLWLLVIIELSIGVVVSLNTDMSEVNMGVWLNMLIPLRYIQNNLKKALDFYIFIL